MNFYDIDFNQLYKEQKKISTFQPKSQKEWNKKAKNISKRIHKSIYNKELINEINFQDSDSMLDVGCGVGNISLLVANKLKKIYALDFSEVMLENLQLEAKKRDIDNIKTIKLSWEDDWENIPMCDIVLASRSMEVADMKEALIKLNKKAKKRVYLTYKVGGSFISDDILNFIGKKIDKKPDFIYTINILYQMGIAPKVTYIKSEGKKKQYTDKKSFVESILWSLGDISTKQIKLLEEYYDNKLKAKEEQDSEYLCWAVISWNKKSSPCL